MGRHEFAQYKQFMDQQFGLNFNEQLGRWLVHRRVDVEVPNSLRKCEAAFRRFRALQLGPVIDLTSDAEGGRDSDSDFDEENSLYDGSYLSLSMEIQRLEARLAVLKEKRNKWPDL